ncbi:MAG: D-alanyl-D-alanine carboxypeptidase family protein [Syntrophothermus sp.]
MAFKRCSILLLTMLLNFGLWVVPGEAANAAGLSIAAKSAILLEPSTGAVIYERNAHQRMPIASLTKLMTLTLALEALEQGKVGLAEMIPGTPKAFEMGGSQIWLEVGEKLPLKDMLYAVGVGSANDAAMAIAEYLGGSEEGFVKAMNRKAQQLGMKNTHFSNPTGLDEPENYSTAYDLALLAKYAIKFPMLLEISSTWDYWLRKGTKKQVWLTTYNKMIIQYPGYDGLKTGFTDKAGYCVVATAKRADLRMIAVLLGEADARIRTEDTRRLLDHGFGALQAVKLAKAGEKIGRVEVFKGASDTVFVQPREDLVAVVPRNSNYQFKKELKLMKQLVAPVRKGQVVGQLKAVANGKTMSTVDLVAASDVQRGGLLKIILQLTRQMIRTFFAM